jgi:hypothetical protein
MAYHLGSSILKSALARRTTNAVALDRACLILGVFNHLPQAVRHDYV